MVGWGGMGRMRWMAEGCLDGGVNGGVRTKLSFFGEGLGVQIPAPHLPLQVESNSDPCLGWAHNTTVGRR